MRLGIGSWTYPWAVGTPGNRPAGALTAAGLVRRAVELDVPVVQVADNLPLDELPARELRDLRDLAADSGVTLEAGTCGFTTSHLLRYLDLAATVGSPLLRVVTDAPAAEPSRREIDRVLEAVLPAFEALGIDLLIENHDRFTAQELASIVRGAGSERLGVVFDTVNSLGSMEGPEQVLSVLAPWVRNVHIKDVWVRRAPHRMGFSVVGAPPGSGDLRMVRLLHLVAQLGRDVTLLIEQWPPDTGDLEASIRTEAAWAEQGLATLRALLLRVEAALA